MKAQLQRICDRLQIDDSKFIEIESKKRVLPKEAKKLEKFLKGRKKVQHVKTTRFFDQFLDTPRLDLLRLGASLRIRYKRNGSQIFLQYKGPGFLTSGVLYRSEFSSGKLKNVILEESHHDIIRFSRTSIQSILRQQAPLEMRKAMRDHLGKAVMSKISVGPVIALYKKEKFAVNLGNVYLEPSLDQVFAFHISKKGMHPLSSFFELENEIKTKKKSLSAKMSHLTDMEDWDDLLKNKFKLRTEKLDKYHRCCSIFLPKKFSKKKKR